MPKKDRIDVPKGHRPEEFLNDARLVDYYEQELEAASGKDRDELAVKLAAAKRAAAMTSSVDPGG